MIHNKLINIYMKKIFFLISIIFTFFLTTAHESVKASSYFELGVTQFNNDEIEKSKISFEKDIVFNPKNEMSYLYLSKIFEKDENDIEQEVNLKNVLLINPNNDEAIYKLVLLKIRQSDFDQAKELISNFKLVCKSFCSKEDELKEKFKKSLPEDEKNNN